MLDAEPEEIPALLGGTALAESFAGVAGPFEIEKGIRNELSKAYDLLERICPDKESIRLFRYGYDFHNLKAMLKSSVSGIPHTDALIDMGTYDVDKLAGEVSENNYRFTPQHLADAALEALAQYESTKRLDSISCSCDRSKWRFLLEKARKSYSQIIFRVFREYIDLANIKTFFRVREFAEDHSIFERYFIPGGSHDLDLFTDHMEEEIGLFLDQLRKTRHERRIVSKGLKTWPEEKSFWRLEIESDNFLLDQFHQMRHQTFSLAPLIYYLLRKISETKLIRTVTGCKLIGMPRSRIEERLRYIYV